MTLSDHFTGSSNSNRINCGMSQCCWKSFHPSHSFFKANNGLFCRSGSVHVPWVSSLPSLILSLVELHVSQTHSDHPYRSSRPRHPRSIPPPAPAPGRRLQISYQPQSRQRNIRCLCHQLVITGRGNRMKGIVGDCSRLVQGSSNLECGAVVLG